MGYDLTDEPLGDVERADLIVVIPSECSPSGVSVTGDSFVHGLVLGGELLDGEGRYGGPGDEFAVTEFGVDIGDTKNVGMESRAGPESSDRSPVEASGRHQFFGRVTSIWRSLIDGRTGLEMPRCLLSLFKFSFSFSFNFFFSFLVWLWVLIYFGFLFMVIVTTIVVVIVVNSDFVVCIVKGMDLGMGTGQSIGQVASMGGQIGRVEVGVRGTGSGRGHVRGMIPVGCWSVRVGA